MKNTLDLRYGVLAVCAGAVLVACGSGASQSELGAPALVASGAHAAIPLSVRYGVLYSFKGGSGDGSNPEADLINVKGTLYGTTYRGGAASSGDGDGTVFSITRSGTETVFHTFGGSGDGRYPQAALINVKGTFYGTTYRGGAPSTNGDGTVFSITPSGTETVLHSFGGSGDGSNPEADLINAKGTLYGTTFYGGAGGSGAFFSITPSGRETVLYSFSEESSGVGGFPQAGLINVKGTLYGTASAGGASNYGTVFSIAPSGTATLLYSFTGSGDGGNPQAGLIDVKGTLYGTTYMGGANGKGTVFSITPSGTETVLHSFGGSGDGSQPEAGLIKVKRTLYGTTSAGGANGEGTVFSITPSGKEAVLHGFGGSGSGDGSNPLAGLINVKGTLYGTTSSGGANSYGTVFWLAP